MIDEAALKRLDRQNVAVEEEFQRGFFSGSAEGAASGCEAQNRISAERANPASFARNTFMPPFQGYNPLLTCDQRLRRSGLRLATIRSRLQRFVPEY